MNSEIFWSEVISFNSFPFEIKTLKVIQTHISYVFITDRWVYKVKKPVNFGFLDFTTLEKRKYFCEKEVELNRRLCPDLYLGVVPITKEGETFKIEGRGEPVEYAVKMKKLPEEGMMGTLLKDGSVTEKHIDLIIEALVPFYKKAKTGEEVNYYGSLEVISYNTEENFSQTKNFVGKALTEDKFNLIVSYTRSFITEKASLFEKRIKEGYIRDGHGDLYSANICFDDLKRVYIFDCIEFNERFRCGDVCSDIAFLAMDLDFNRYRNLSDYFVEEYLKKSEDLDLPKLLNFYKCYRAYVRGKIGCFTYASLEVPEREREKALKKAQEYFDLAYLYAGGIPKVVVFVGLSGTGKTFLANQLLNKRPAVYISSDIIRKKLLNLELNGHYYAPFEKGIYSPQISEKTYEKMLEIAKEEVNFGRDVILDATFRDLKFRNLVRESFKNLPVKVYWIWCRAKDETIKDRITKRIYEGTVSDALWDIYLAQKEKFQPPLECIPLLILDTEESSKVLGDIILDFLQSS